MGSRVVVAVVGLAAACGGGGGGSAEVDAPHADGSPADASSDARNVDAPIPRSGQVLVADSQAFGIALAGADFYEGSGSGGTLLGTSGPCTATASSGGPSSAKISAGTIVITGTVNPVMLVPAGTKPNVSYSTPSLPAPPFAASASVMVSAPGTADFPAFSAVGTAPARLAGFSPPAGLSRAAGYTAMWTAGSPGQIRISVTARYAPYDGLRCIVPDTGSFTITPAALALLPASDTRVNVSVARIGDVTTAAPNVELLLMSSMGNLGYINLDP